MPSTSFLLTLTALAATLPLAAQLPATIATPDAKVELIQGGFKFTEGPAVSPTGQIYFTDIPNNRIHVYDPVSKKLEIHRENTGAANGLMFDSTGALIACEGGNRIVTRQVFGEEPKPIATAWNGKKLNSPNDLDIDLKGGIYFTDPRYGKGDNREIDIEAVYYLPPNGGEVIQVVSDLKKPNGIALSPDRKTLYVADNGAGSLHAYDVNDTDGTLTNARLISPEVPGCDGMCVDTSGNLFVTTKEGVKIFTPTGTHLGTIAVPEGPANCTFGAQGTKTLYITARTGFYQIQLGVDGLK
ncbi:SMP-30/gluconolactonase/LRE family protein [Phragmitibacter flavus]|uniref:SMP-30/gluconolactonase/LRE family protein n=1 Tax=Phragmitibacter flavus TaxID=2576071 RepID=A0A5R8K9R9_9BACT|nr:SMP-30/gluconolactonase/LRE family protein [Phragmitibacter flavus]TLD69082.1 SMP-30/gluconolactonase/LRE family protein [Phragmitibacter flavus]